MTDGKNAASGNATDIVANGNATDIVANGNAAGGNATDIVTDGNVTGSVRTVDLTEVEKDFSRAKAIADESGSAVIFENGKPRYLLVDILNNADERLSHEETVDLVAKRVLEKHRKAFEQLAE